MDRDDAGTVRARRETVRSGVFRPSHRLPTMTIEEFADLEIADAQERSEREKAAAAHKPTIEEDMRRRDQLALAPETLDSCWHELGLEAEDPLPQLSPEPVGQLPAFVGPLGHLPDPEHAQRWPPEVLHEDFPGGGGNNPCLRSGRGLGEQQHSLMPGLPPHTVIQVDQAARLESTRRRHQALRRGKGTPYPAAGKGGSRTTPASSRR